MPQLSSSGKASAALDVAEGDQPAAPRAPEPTVAQTDQVAGRFQAVINTHDSNLHQIEVAIQANVHALDPHPILPGQYVSRHPVLLACYDPSQLDEQGQPLPGKPAELDIDTIRAIYSARYPHVSPEPPPADGSHVDVPGMHFIGELDSSGRPTGRVKLGNPSEVK